MYLNETKEKKKENIQHKEREKKKHEDFYSIWPFN